MEPGMRSGGPSGSGVLIKSRNSSGCLIVRKKGDGLCSTATATAGVGSSTSRKMYGSKKRPNVNMSLSDSGSSDELPMPPARRLGPETIRVCNGLTAFERGMVGGSEINRKRDRLEQIRGNGEGMIAESGLDKGERKRNKLGVFDFNEHESMDVEKMRRRHFDNNGVGLGGGRFMGSVHMARSGIDREFETGSSRHILDKRKNLYPDRPSGLYPGDNVDHSRLKMNRDGDQLPLPLLREKFNSDKPIRVQGKNGVLKVMVNKKKVGGPLEHYAHCKPVDSRQRLKTEGTAKGNVLIHPASYFEAKPFQKSGLLVRPEKKQIASRKSLSSKDSRRDEYDSDNSDTSLNPGMRNVEAHKPAKRIISEDEQTPVHEKLPPTTSKEGKIKRGSGTEKQKLRERIREMLLNAGWTIDYRPRRNRDYLDAVYINPAGTAYWSIIKAYDALQKQLNDDVNEAKPKGDSSSFAPIADEVLSQLTRKTKKKMEKELKKKKKKKIYDSESESGKEPHIRKSASNKHDMNSVDSDSNEEKLSSFIKQGSKSMKNKMIENTNASASSKSQNATHHSNDGMKKSFSGCDPHILHGRQSRKHGRCTLLVRSSTNGLNSESDGFVPYTGKRTVLSWLIDSGSVELSQKVQYRRRKKVLLEGWITRDGIHCGCCSKILTVSKFELHAGSKLPQPYQNIFLESGVSLLQCQIDAWSRQENSGKIGFHSVDIDGDDPNDDTCGICGDGGDLICCDGCPSTFHQSCLDIQMLPPGEWHCPNCTCKFCGIASGTSKKEVDATTKVLCTCNLCEKKYHSSCAKEMDAFPNDFNTSDLSFCGEECKELFEHLKKYLGTKNELEAGFSWSLIHRTNEDSEAGRGITQRVECNSKLAIALTVMDECFLPVVDRRSGINIIRNVLYNSGSNFSRLNYSGFYTAILERGDEIISAASIRFHGTKLAEMPFIGTRNIYRRQGMCRRLFSAIESVLCTLKVEKLVIPAIAELMHTWTAVFGFTHLEESLRQEMKSLNLLVFPGVDMLQKLFVEQGKHEGSAIAAGLEKLKNGDNVFIKTKLANKSDMDSSTLQDSHGSDDASSNPANEMNDECSDASQELNNQVAVDRTMCSKSRSEERLSDSVSDKFPSPNRSDGAPEMKNKIAMAPVDKLNPCSSICQSVPLNGSSMNCNSSEFDINLVLDSRVAHNTLPSEEVYMTDAHEVLEAVPSGNLSEENITKENKQNVDISESVPSGNLSEENITKENKQNVDISESVLNHADESLLQDRSDSNGDIGYEGEKNLHLNIGVASNEI
ncbi:Zinc finger, PHD-type [Sesbania bispinosa]|nr:Zinc finger, PHD-type [Sesbania bispinosa]